ncbi:creatininase family protein [uncultured Maritalea sp.]|jgi:creatinine amidohydrolase|uniref:creatininase family protein n=1 Tax=uncultured Maritalea sp. TaxID=757249 RepID=UPI00263415A2|nr:creatininase family protein [uncultured Maritalea sp.]
MPIFNLMDLKRDQLAELVDAQTVGVLPVGAIEPHGPHLPLSTDCDIAQGHLNAAQELAIEANVLVFPLQQIGASDEHDHFVGTLSFDAENLFQSWYEIGARFHAWGGRRLVIMSSHGGNSGVVDRLILALRRDFAMLAVSSAWLRFGQPEGLFDEEELKFGIHGGNIETSLMLHYAPQKVDMDAADHFESALKGVQASAHHLTGYGKHHFGWMSHDLNDQGVVGNASVATAAKGMASAAHAVRGFGELIDDVAQFNLLLFDLED